MKIPPTPHRWDVSPKQAVAIQGALAGRVCSPPLRGAVRLAAGVDMAISPDGERCVAGVVLWDMKARTVCEAQLAWCALTFPYVPGLLSFREAPAVLAALRRLEREPDVILCDGQGYAHPRRFGIACHLGVILDRPTIGCAKSRLVGDYAEPAPGRGARAALTAGGERIGTVLRTRDGVKPVYVSVGHRIDLDGAVRIVLRCGGGYRVPEPTRLADRLVARARREMTQGNAPKEWQDGI